MEEFLLIRQIEAELDAARGLVRAGAWAEAATIYRRLIEMRPDFLPARLNGGTALMGLDRAEEALDWFAAAAAQAPQEPRVWERLGAACHEAGAFAAAIGHLDRALDLDPALRPARVMRASTRLLTGDFAGGWRDLAGRGAEAATGLDVPVWRGEPVAGRALVVVAEGGFGDTIFFARYLPRLAASGGKLHVFVQPELRSLLAANWPDISFPADGDRLPRIHYQCAAFDLPIGFGTDAPTIPSSSAYLRSDPARAALWRQRMEPMRGRMHVGIVWAGNKRTVVDYKRSLNPRLLAPLLAVPDIAFVSLQPGGQCDGVLDVGAALDSFAATASLIDALDLVITVDTAVAHLAGALGKPTWLLLPAIPDWRWQLNRRDSPWYSSMTLFRQSQRGNWDIPIAELADRLRAWRTNDDPS